MRAADRSGGGGDDAIVITSPEFHALFVATKAWDKKLYTELRKGLRDAGKPLVAAVKAEIGQIPSGGQHGTGIRAGLQAGTRASIRAASAKSAGVRIVTSPSRLPAGKKSLAKALNKPMFRHPVFPDPDRPRAAWGYAEQAGRPYFGTAILAHRDEVAKEVRKAMDRAIEGLMS